jgi:4-amino-4-deoxy-L-arabinose transferase-like glycosyltransferase
LPLKIQPRRFAFRSWYPWALLAALGLAGASVYFVQVPGHPPGFSIDESSICYNAYTIATTGRDEYSKPWPLFFRAFGEYKNPTIIYVLAGLFRLTGPDIPSARFLSAALGLTTCLLLGLLAWQMTGRWNTTVTVTLSALFTPWLFESSRLVFEVAIYPATFVLFLLVVWRCARKDQWHWLDILALALTLALLTYSYSIGRLLGPLLAFGLIFFVNRTRAPALASTWILYAILLLPLLAFHLNHPDALTGRFKALTYLGNRGAGSLPARTTCAITFRAPEHFWPVASAWVYSEHSWSSADNCAIPGGASSFGLSPSPSCRRRSRPIHSRNCD